LLPVSGSVVSAGGQMTAVLLSDVAAGSTRPVIVKVALPPANSETVVTRLPLPDTAAQLEPLLATHVHVGDKNAALNVSVTLAPVTGLGPLLVTTIVQPIDAPALTVGLLGVFVSARSASRPDVSDAV
jgi:hypothetical protein